MDFSQFILTILEKYGVEAGILISLIFALVIVTIRSLPKVITAWAEARRTRASAEATTKTTEVQNEAKVLDILQQQVNNTQTTNNILLQYQAEFAQSRQTTERVAAGLEGMEKESRALRISLEAWPKTVDATLADNVTALGQMQAALASLKAESDNSHKAVLELVQDMQADHKQMVTQIAAIYGVHFPPPTEPASAKPAAPPNVLDMDGAKADATVDLPVTTESKRDVA